MAVRRWIDLDRYDGAQMLIAAECPPDGRNRLVVRDYVRSDLSKHGFEKLGDGLWMGDSPSFKVTDLRLWFPGFDPSRDIKDIDAADILIGYEDLDLRDAEAELDALATSTGKGAQPSMEEQGRRIREQADAEAVNGVIRSFPPGGELLARPSPSEDKVRLLAAERLPASAAARIGAINGRLEQARTDLATEVARYEELRIKGISALSNYDIVVAFSGDAVAALRGSLNFKSGHIRTAQARLEALVSEANALEQPHEDEAREDSSSEDATSRTEAEQEATSRKTPGTNIRWTTLREWVKGWRAIERRAPSATRHTQLAAHLDALSAQIEVIVSETSDAVLVSAKRLIEGRQPPRGTREGHSTTEVLQRIGTVLNKVRSAARDAQHQARLASAKALGEGNGMTQTYVGGSAVWHIGDFNARTEIQLNVYSPLHSGKTRYGVRRFFDGEYASGTYDNPDSADQAIKANDRAAFEAIAQADVPAESQQDEENGPDAIDPHASTIESLRAYVLETIGNAEAFDGCETEAEKRGFVADYLSAAEPAERVRQFGFAMRELGLEMDGLDPRVWSVDLGGGHEVHASLDQAGAVQVRRLAGEEWVEEWDGAYSAEATRQTRDFVQRAMRAPLVHDDEWSEGDTNDPQIDTLRGRVSRFASGMSRAKDFHPAARAEHGIGVDIGELSDAAMRELADRIVNMRAEVFVDSGAFGLFKRGLKSDDVRPMDFDAVLAKYGQLQQYIAEANVAEESIAAPMLVMPDVVGDQAASLELVAKYRDWIKAETQFQVSRPIIPLQRGDLTLSEAYARVVEILGNDQFIVGIPSNAAAISPDEFVSFLRQSKPKAIHILGALADRRLNPRLQQIVEAGVDADIEVSADANILRSKILTPDLQPGERATRIEKVLSGASIEADFDATRDAALRRARGAKNPERTRERIEDAGEKIGGARKDFYRSALRASDLAEMNDREKAELVTKDNVWPSRTIEDYRQAGVDSRVALFLQYLRREFPQKPGKPELIEPYVELVGKLQEVMATCKTYDDVASFADKLGDAGVLEITQSSYGKRTAMEDRYNDVLYGSMNRSWGFVDNYFYSPEAGYRRAQNAYRGRSFLVNGEYIRASDLDSDGFYGLLATLKQRTVERQKQTRENRSSDDPDKAALARPHLAKVIRDGLPDERGGRDITGDDLLNDFGFRACEFGNWLPDTERQDVLNRAYDAFSSLSRVLGVPKRALSLGGTLAVAFGSRGAGRWNAHYECTRKVINLTRLRGAGSLAHEWAHALDDFVGERMKQALGDSMVRRDLSHLYFASDMFVKRYRERRGGKEKFEVYGEDWRLPGSVQDMKPIIELANTIGVRPWSKAEVLQQVTTDMMSHERKLLSALTEILGNIRPDEQPDAVREQARKLVEQVRADALHGERISRSATHPLQQSLADTRTAPMRDDQRKRHEYHVRRLSTYVADYLDAFELVQDESLRNTSEHAKKRTYTKYAADAKHFDAKKSDQYWSVMHELTARAFETYVQDQLAENGWRDDYLVHGTEESSHEHRVHSAYPMGEDRTGINKAIAAYIELVKSKFSDDLQPQDAHASAPRLRVA